MPFDPDKFLADVGSTAPAQDSFNPDKFLADVGAQPAAPDRAGEAAIEGFGQGASLGYMPQLQAAAYKPMESVLNAIGMGDNTDAELKAKGFDVKGSPDSYLQMRDENVAREDALKASNPKAYYGGAIAGGVATAPVLDAAASLAAPAKLISVAPSVVKAASSGDAIAQAAVRAAQLRKAMVLGGLAGGVANPGDTQGVVDPLQAGDRAKNAAVGVATGAVVDKAAQGVGKLADALSSSGDAIEGLSNKFALKSAGAQKPQINKLLKQGGIDKLNDVGRFIVDENIAPAGATAEDIAANAKKVKDAAGQQISDVFDKIQSSGKAGTFDRKTIAQAMRDSLAGDDSVGGSLDADEIMPKLDKYISNFEGKDGPATARELLELKGKFDARVNYSRAAQDLPEMQQGYKNLRTTINEAINDRAQALSNQVRGDIGQQLLDANKRYGLASSVHDIAQNKLAQAGNNVLSLNDTMTGLAGMIAMGPKGLALAAANKVARNYGPSAVAKGLRVAAQGMKAVGPFAGAALEDVAPSAGAAAAGETVAGEAAPAARQVLSGSSRPTLPRSGVADQDQTAPTKGPGKWANDGFDKLMQHGRNPAGLSNLKSTMLQDPVAKQQLINANDLKPGSKAMDKILARLKERYGTASS